MLPCGIVLNPRTGMGFQLSKGLYYPTWKVKCPYNGLGFQVWGVGHDGAAHHCAARLSASETCTLHAKEIQSSIGEEVEIHDTPAGSPVNTGVWGIV